MNSRHITPSHLVLTRTQAGVGLIEVLVSLLLLAVAVLGYIGLQTRTVAATSDGLVKSNMITIMRDLADRIRYNPTAIAAYRTDLNTYSEDYKTSGAATAPETNCDAATCSAAQQAAFDTYEAVTRSYSSGFSIRMEVCPGTTGNGVMETQCLLGAWGDTTATIGTTAATDCIDQTTGNYYRRAQCLIMEVQ